MNRAAVLRCIQGHWALLLGHDIDDRAIPKGCEALAGEAQGDRGRRNSCKRASRFLGAPAGGSQVIPLGEKPRRAKQEKTQL